MNCRTSITKLQICCCCSCFCCCCCCCTRDATLVLTLILVDGLIFNWDKDILVLARCRIERVCVQRCRVERKKRMVNSWKVFGCLARMTTIPTSNQHDNSTMVLNKAKMDVPQQRNIQQRNKKNVCLPGPDPWAVQSFGTRMVALFLSLSTAHCESSPARMIKIGGNRW